MKKILLLVMTVTLMSVMSPLLAGKSTVFEMNGMHGVLSNGDTIIRPIYDKILKHAIVYCGDTIGVYFQTYKDGKTGLYIGKSAVMPCEFDSVADIKREVYEHNGSWYFRYFTAIVEKGDLKGFFDVLNSKAITPCKFSKIVSQYSTWYAYLPDGRWGLYSHGGSLLVPVGAADALRGGPYHSDLYIVEKNGKYGAYHKGKLIIPVIHSRYEGVNDNYNPQKIFFEQSNRDNTGKTHYIYSISGRLIAKKFFYNDQRRALNAWWTRYAQ